MDPDAISNTMQRAPPRQDPEHMAPQMAQHMAQMAQQQQQQAQQQQPRQPQPPRTPQQQQQQHPHSSQRSAYSAHSVQSGMHTPTQQQQPHMGQPPQQHIRQQSNPLVPPTMSQHMPSHLIPPPPPPQHPHMNDFDDEEDSMLDNVIVPAIGSVSVSVWAEQHTRAIIPTCTDNSSRHVYRMTKLHESCWTDYSRLSRPPSDRFQA